MIDHGFSTARIADHQGVTVVLTLDLHPSTTDAFIDFQTGEMTTGATC